MLSISVLVFVFFVTLGVVLSSKKSSPTGSNNATETDKNQAVHLNLASKKDADIILVGAGIVGATLAATLGRQGKKVIAVERDLSEPNRIVGELLQPGGVQHINTLGLQECFEGIDSPVIEGYAVFNGDHSVNLEYPSNNGVKPHGRSFHHGRFLQNLRKAASEQPTVTLVEGTVSSMIEEGDQVVGVKYKQNGEVKELFAPLVVVCDGVFSNFRKALTGKKPIVKSSFVGFVVPDIKLPFGQKGHVFLTDGAPTLCYPISSTEARFLVDIPNPIPSNSNGDLVKHLKEQVVAKLPSPVQECVMKQLESGKITVRSMPCSRLHSSPVNKRGVLVLGDAWNMRHPITGGGMTVAFSDIVLLSSVVSKFENFDDWDKLYSTLESEFYPKRVGRVAATNILAEAIYQVFAGRGDMKAMQQAIYSYFTLGPSATTVPVSLLGCIETNPWSLITHFFIVAVYASVKMILQNPLKIFSSLSVLLTASKFFIPLLFNEHVVYIPFLNK